MSGTGTNRETEFRANELYWGSEWGVNQIAEELDLSKGMLYGLIRPRPSAFICPQCAEELVYANRTAKERHQVACPSCGWEGDEADADDHGGDGGVALPRFDDEEEDDDDVRMPPFRLSSNRQRTVMGGALLGAAAGLALVLWARRR